MTMSNYPGGFTDGILIRGMPITQTHPGKVFWVGNAAAAMLDGQRAPSNGNQGTFNDPFSTLDYAIGKCKASRGDIIMIKPGHAENVASAGAITFDVAGVAVVGLGVGSLRPTFTFTTGTGADIAVTAANVSVQNIIFASNFENVADCFDVVSAPEFTVEYCEFRDLGAALSFTNIIDTDAVANGCDGLYFCNNRVISLDATAATTVINIDEGQDRVTANDNFLVMAAVNNTPALLDLGAFNMTALEVARNIVFRPNTDTSTGGILLEGTGAAMTGMVYGNHCKTLDVAGMLIMTLTSALGFHENYLSGTADTSGLLIPAADSDGS